MSAAPETGGWTLASRGRSVTLAEGLNLVMVGRTNATIADAGIAGRGVAGGAGFALPAVSVAAAPSGSRAPLAIVSAADAAPGWLDGAGGTVVVKVPAGGGRVVVTVYGLAADAAPPEIRVVNLNDRRLPELRLPEFRLPELGLGDPRLSDPGPHDPGEHDLGAAGKSGDDAAGRGVEAELILHIERQGDRRQAARGWAGNPGQPLRVEGFAVLPLGELNPGDIEYMGFGLAGRQTPWVSDGKLCGTRGRGLPLTGFAVRLAPGAGERFDVIYEGYFFRSGVAGPVRNGEPCLPAMADDSLAAIRLRIIERQSA